MKKFSFEDLSRQFTSLGYSLNRIFRYSFRVVLLLVLSAGLASALMASVVVQSVTPSQNALNASTGVNITVIFNVAMNTSTLTTSNIIVYGTQSGKHTGVIALSGDTTFTFNPNSDFKAGEIVNVSLSKNITSAAGDTLTNGYHWNFTIKNKKSTGTFAPAIDYGVGNDPLSSFVNDLDGDGDGDIAVANGLSNTISILKNNGNGTFAVKVDYATGIQPYSLFVDDLDGDGDGDIAVTDAGSNTVSILMNNGDGTFATKVDYATGSAPHSIFISDLDGDGYGDIAIANHFSNTVSILKNNGNGTFASEVEYPTGSNPQAVFISDIDGDGDGDIAVANNNSNTISILRNNGKGTFAAKVDYTTGSIPYSISINDLDGDGDGDIAVANAVSGNISILKNNGDGTFAGKVDYTAGDQPLSISINDVDGDNDGDLTVANLASNTISILKNNGNGTFATNVDYPGENLPYSIFTSDLDGDGDGDIIVANTSSNYISVSKNIGGVTTYTISASGNQHGTINPSGEVIVDSGGSKRFIYSPFNGYHVSSVLVDGVNVDSANGYTFNNVNANHTISVLFLQNPGIGGVVYNDISGNGLKENNEPSLSGWKVYFYYNDSLSLVDSTITNEEGFIKDELQPGTYYISTEIHSGWVKTFPKSQFQIVTVSDGEQGVTGFGFSLGSTITLKKQLDADKDFLTTDDRITVPWRFSISLNGNELAQSNDTILTLSQLAPGAYVVSPTDSFYYSQLGTIVDGVATADTARHPVSVSVGNGKNIHVIFVDRYDMDSTTFRTLRTDSTLSLKPVTLKKKKGKPFPMPNYANIRDTILKYSSAVKTTGGIIVGKQQTEKASIKLYGWLRWIKGADIGKFFTNSHTGRSYPLDTIRGTKKKVFVKELKGDRRTYNNPLAAELAVFKMNLKASSYGVFPPYFDRLQYLNSVSPFNGMDLLHIADSLDFMMTYWKVNNYLRDSAQAEGAKIMLKNINEAFYVPLTDSLTDLQVYPSVITYKGITNISHIPFLRRNGKDEIRWNFLQQTEIMPTGYTLEQNYPNPFNPTTAIGFSLLAVGNVSLKVYNVLGQEVAILLNNESMEPGEHEIQFDASHLTSGVYFYRLEVNGGGKQIFAQAKKLLLLK